MKKIRMMMMAALAALAVSASAQDGDPFGTFYLQYNIASMKTSYDGHSSSESLNAATVGYNYAFPITDMPLYIEPGIAAQYFWKEDFKMASAKVPVSVVYDIEIADGISLDPFAGVYARFNAWGETGDDDVKLFDDWEDGGAGAKRFQFGFHIGLRARFNNKFMVGVNYSQDLNDFIEHTKINSIDLTLGINF